MHLHSLARAFADCTKKGYRWRLRPNCLYQLCELCDLDTCRICKQQKTRQACTFAQSCKIMFEFLPSCEWDDLLATFEKREKNCLDELGFFTCTKVKVNQISVIRYHGSRRYLLWQNSPHKEEAALKNMTNMHQRIALCKFKIQWSTHLPNRGHRNGEFQDVERYYFRGLPK